MRRILTGDKLLISLLRHTAEWDSPHARVLAARACDASGDKELARILRCLDHSSDMSKSHMLFLTRVWGYRSDIWQPEDGGRSVMVEQVRVAEAQLDALAAAPSDMQVDCEHAAGAGRTPRCLDATHGPGCTLCVPHGHFAPASSRI